MSFRNFNVPYQIDERYSKRVAYFSMEFAVHQPLKIYSGGLGFLSGSHLRSAYELRQNLIGIGILWKYGYYDQARNQDQTSTPPAMRQMIQVEVAGVVLNLVTARGATAAWADPVFSTANSTLPAAMIRLGRAFMG